MEDMEILTGHMYDKDMQIERLRAALATVRIFIEGETVASAIVVPEGAMTDDPNNPSLLKLIDAALGDEQSARGAND